MKTIKLYGALRAKFGKVFHLDVRTPAEAIRALCFQVKGFRQHLAKFSEPGYVVRVGAEDRGADELAAPLSSKEEIRIIPVTSGANAATRIILGTVLIVAGMVVTAGSGGSASPLGTALIASGISMVIGGVAELLAPSPKTTKSNAKKDSPSYMFDGPINTIGSGYAVTVGYGEMLVGSHVVSADLYSVEEPI